MVDVNGNNDILGQLAKLTKATVDSGARQGGDSNRISAAIGSGKATADASQVSGGQARVSEASQGSVNVTEDPLAFIDEAINPRLPSIQIGSPQAQAVLASNREPLFENDGGQAGWDNARTDAMKDPYFQKLLTTAAKG